MVNSTCAKSSSGYTRSDCTLVIPRHFPTKRSGFLSGLTLVQQVGVAIIFAIIFATAVSIFYLGYRLVIDCRANAERRRDKRFRFPRNFPSDYLLREDAVLPDKSVPDDNPLVPYETTQLDDAFNMALSVCGQVEMIPRGIAAVSTGLIEVC